MAGSFREKLLKLYHDDTGRFGMKRNEAEYKTMIRYGVLGQMNENHFLFLYRDMYRKSAYYGAVIFFDRPDELGNPVRVICIEQDSSERNRDAYIKAALFFINNSCENTMNLSGSVLDVFEMAKKKIDTYIDRRPPPPDESNNFNFDPVNRKIAFKEVEIQDVSKIFKNHLLKENLTKLLASTADIVEKETEQSSAALLKPVGDAEQESRTRALPGLNLKVELADFTKGQTFYFHPLIIPIKRDKSFSKPRRVESSTASAYEFEFGNIPASLTDFFKLIALDSEKASYHAAKLKILNQLYFPGLAEALFTIPDELVYCQPADPGNDRDYKSLKRIKFKKVEIRFAPSLKKDSGFDIFLRFSASKKQVLNARDNYEIKIIDDKVYIFFISTGGDYYFAVPEEAKHFLPLFNFLLFQREFYLYDFTEVAAALKSISSQFIAVEPQLLKKYKFNLLPTPILKICKKQKKQETTESFNNHDNKDDREHLEIEFDYTSEIKKFIAKNPDKEVFSYEKDETVETACINLLKSDPLLKLEIGRSESTQSIIYYFSFRDCDYTDWLMDAGKKYLERGFKIFSAEWKSFIGNTGSTLQISASADIDWLEFTPTIGDPGTDSRHKIGSFDLDKNIIIDEKGRLHLVTRQDIDKLIAFSRYCEYNEGVFRAPSRNYILIKEIYEKKIADLPAIDELLKTGKKLANFDKIGDYDISPGFQGVLRDYQKQGFNWLNFLDEYDFSGCLADDMGLGKTIQALALLLSLKDSKKLKTSLLVVPVSAIPNWEMEIERFTPALTYYRHQGINRDKDSSRWSKKNLVITSYATMRNDIEIFKDFGFDYIILDESQNIKNYFSQVSRAAKIIKGNHRLALSGTPIENNLFELWSLFDFLMPGFLGTPGWFRNQFVNPIEKERDSEKIELLKKMIYPFMMRRKKEEVEKELPEKIEITSRLRMDEEQLKLYAETAECYRKQLDEQIDENNVQKSAIQVFEALLRLRQICLFPRLADEKYAHIPSAKFDYLVELLGDIRAENHKVLIFSQFVEVLHIIRKYLDDGETRYAYIDGSVDIVTREKMVKAFQQEEEIGIFLLSLKAGGAALNLTAADYVIIFDPWWNPAVEAQAIDRSHRIGQTRKVFAYKMVLADSIEEKILQLQEHKRILVDEVIAADNTSFKDLGKGDILDLFSSAGPAGRKNKIK
ncbi:MAG: DEAD/DEAH box helicase [Candidatus Aminicenantes bacterium]|nr:DEAD/DEAH box helicase [Candidatus Aminicenantes bacterium]